MPDPIKHLLLFTTSHSAFVFLILLTKLAQTSFPLHPSFLIFPYAMALEAVRHFSGLMRGTSRFTYQRDERIILECRPVRNPGTKIMTGAARTCAGGKKYELTMRIHSCLVRDLRQRAAVFRMAGGAGRPLRHHVPMQSGARCGRAPLKIPVRMADDAARLTGPTKRFMALCAGSNIGMVAAQVSGSPQCRGMPP